ncbi:hypothetical protein L198_00041 [Cryptococcus wingfieldii CBS 7118]|uniref:Peptide hydrolase n=1 Tax=Cryptococcus wingfieldii CBS 7118 TaxID=1295528 RepID=A0A1E3K704_9TREE|nr:hypothetical protein L198_00041 [Cryptococcus wingfieldii CBS 7118]ODO08317.1 hypothetical protein L198_00041 [Cryptococcus wingfieldii CBS 7118]
MPPKSPSTPRKRRGMKGGKQPIASTPTSPGEQAKQSKQQQKHHHRHVVATAPVHLPLQKAGKLSWTLLGLIFAILPWVFGRLHYALPEPLPPLDADGIPQPSEEVVRSHIQALEDIGYRIVGTPAALAGEQYVLDQVLELVEQCNARNVLNCEWWHQKGDGLHAFEILDHEVLKSYTGISNIILKISAFHPPSYDIHNPKPDKDAILLGAHIDSTFPSPGAADDAIGVGVMLDLARTLIHQNDPFDNSIIFLFNGAEETLQDGSHLYSIEHSTRTQVKAVINLEAAGSKGGALLFQATSGEMIEAYGKVPYPKGTVIAADVFSSGIIMSDTDFGQFEKYLGVSGLDMAIVGHSYFYHTHHDTLSSIQPGSAQHFTSNIHAVVSHLLSPSSPLSSNLPWSPPDKVYFGLFDKVFLYWDMKAADRWYTALAAVSGVLAVRRLKGKGWKIITTASLATISGLAGGFIGPNLLAFTLTKLGRPLLWFTHEHLPTLIYIPTAFLSSLSIHLFFTHFLSPVERTKLEAVHYGVQMLWCSWMMLALQAVKVRSAYLFAGITLFLLIGALGDGAVRVWGKEREGMNFKATYLLPSIGLIAFFVEAITAALDIFTPLTGRMGKSAPAEHIIATLTAACGLGLFPTLTPLFHRLPRQTQRKVVLVLKIWVAGVVGYLGLGWLYDGEHPKRVGLNYNYNHTDQSHIIHIALMDLGPTGTIPSSLHARYALPSSPLIHKDLEDEDHDWDAIYPVSTFLDTYKFELDISGQGFAQGLEGQGKEKEKEKGGWGGVEGVENFEWPEMGWSVKEKGGDGFRDVEITFNFTDLVWPVLSFHAHVLSWSFPEPAPPAEYMQHHIKFANSVDSPLTTLKLRYKVEEPGQEKLGVHWSAFDVSQMNPFTTPHPGGGKPATVVLTDMWDWIGEQWGGDLDLVTGGVVCGVVQI